MTVPVTIIAGFLGAGKTTLINRILATPVGVKATVMVNDFGDLNIDASLIKEQTDNLVQLTNGCVCCNVMADLVGQVATMLSSADPPEYLIVETSGVSDPKRVAAAFGYPQIRDRVSIDGIITIVDCEALESISEDIHTLVESQIDAADMIILNKMDVTSQESIDRFKAEWLYPKARVIETSNCEVPIDVLMGIHLNQQSLKSTVKADHTKLFQTASYQESRPFDYKLFKQAIQELPVGIFRVKGFLYLDVSESECVEFQMVGSRTNFKKRGSWSEGEVKRSSLVFISIGGNGTISENWIADHFAKAVQPL